MSQRQLAHAAGLRQATIWAVETGKHKPQYRTAAKIARALNADPAVLFPEVYR